jgi:hypothetical protein
MVASVALLAGAALVASPAAHAASSNFGYGYVWANNPSTAIGVSYTPSTTYQFNSTGRLNTITRTGVGAYSVVFPDFGPRGTALVTAYGAGDARCKIDRFSVLPPNPFNPNEPLDTVVRVRCFDRNGAPVDSMFTAIYTYPEPGMTRSAYLLYDRPGFLPNPNFTHNSTGAANLVTRADAGRYNVTLPGLGLPSSSTIPRHVKVTAYGAASDPSAFCSVDNVDSVGNDAVAEVRCFSPQTGARTDSGFTLSYVETGDILFTPAGSRPMAYATPECLADPLGCNQGLRTFDSNPSADISITKVGPGQYAVQVPLDLVGGNVQVGNWWTGRSASRITCKVAFWNSFDGVRVNCFDRFGNPPTGTVVFAVSFVR